MQNVFIIAEAGVNHNGSVELALKMVDVAIEAGVDAIKFQTFKSEKLVSKFAQKAEYQKRVTDIEESQLEMIKKLEFDEIAHIRILEYCKAKGIMFLSTPFDLESVDMLDRLGMEIFKIPSGEITNLPLLRKIGSLKKPVIMSTGMCRLDEIESAINILEKAGSSHSNISVLHCNTEYPTPFSDVNLQAILTIKEKLNVKTGYSDHTIGIEIPVAAVALGATIIEKHFTLDKSMEGPDHKASLDPDELKKMVQAIRNVEISIGTGVKEPSPSEMKNIVVARKSIVAACRIKKGEVFTEKNITVKRPGNGISPMLWDQIIGKHAKKDFEPDELIIIDK